MQPNTAARCALGLVCLSAAVDARADGPGAYAARQPPTAVAQAHPGAVDSYHAGYALILQAEHAENLAAASSDSSERGAAQHAAQEAYRAAIEKLTAAVDFDGSLRETHTYLGYAQRKLGRYEQALQAYSRALQLGPDYPAAIEYQGEALLGLGRLSEARFNYLRLYALDPTQAAKLFKAMQGWVEQHRGNAPPGVDIAAFAVWLEERAMLNPQSQSKKPAGWSEP